MQLTDTPLPVEFENEDLEEVEEFTYLRSVMSKSNATVKDITNRLQKAKSSFVQLNKVWRSEVGGRKSPGNEVVKKTL